MKRRSGQHGFSLIELLVVLIIIGVAAGAVRLAITEEDPLRDMQQAAEQLAYRIGQGQDRVMLSNRERGLYFLSGGVRFLQWSEGDPMMGEPEIIWSESETPPIEWQAGEDIQLQLELDGEWVELFQEMPEDPLTWEPHVILLPSEDYTPAFELEFRDRRLLRGRIIMQADGFNRPEVSRVEE